MHHTSFTRGRLCALAPAAVLLLALCLLAVGAQALTDSPALVIDEPGLYTLDHDLAPDATVGVLINGSDVVFDGMGHSIAGTGANGSVGVLVSGRTTAEGEMSANVTVRNLTVSGWDDGIRIAETTGTVVEHVVAEQNGVGLGISPTTGITGDHHVRDSVFRENTGAGLDLFYPAEGITIERCEVTGNGVGISAFDIGHGSPNTLADSEISRNTGDGLNSRDGSFSVVRNCTVAANGDDGLEFEHGGAEIVGCHIEKNAAAGVDVSDRGGSDIHGNWIEGNAIGVSDGGDWPSHVRNNVLNNTDNGFFRSNGDIGTLNYTKSAGPNIIGGPYLGGNYWAFPNGTGFSQTHPDTNGDGFCDEPYPVTEDAIDYLPLALQNGTPTPTPTPTPAFGGSPYKPLSVPGRIQAEDYNAGGEGVAYHDTTPGNSGGAYRRDDVDIETAGGITNVGWIRDGEHLTYTVHVSGAGLYLVSLRVATPNSGRSVEVSADGGRPITYWLPNTGSFTTYATATLGSTPCPNTWMTVTQTPTPMATGIENQRIPIQLSNGTHVIKLAFRGDGQNLDWFELAPGTPARPASRTRRRTWYPAGSSPRTTTRAGTPTPHRPTRAARTARTPSTSSAAAATTTSAGSARASTLEYSVDTSSANNYHIGFRVANPGPAKAVTVRINGGAPKTLAIPATGSFSSWQTATLFAGWLPAGRNTVRIETGTASSFNLDYMQFNMGETQPPTSVTTTPTTPAAGEAGLVAVPTTAPKGSAVKFTVTPAAGKTISSAWWSFDAAAHLNTWNSRSINPTFFYPAKGTFSPLVKITYTDGSTETVQRTGYITAT